MKRTMLYLVPFCYGLTKTPVRREWAALPVSEDSSLHFYSIVYHIISHRIISYHSIISDYVYHLRQVFNESSLRFVFQTLGL